MKITKPVWKKKVKGSIQTAEEMNSVADAVIDNADALLYIKQNTYEKTEVDAKINPLITKTDTLTTKVSALESDVATVKTNLTNTTVIATRADSMATTALGGIQNLTSQLNTEVIPRIKNLEDKTDVTNTDVTTLKTDVKKVGDRCDTLEVKQTATEQAVTSLSNKVVESQIEIGDLQLDMLATQDNVTELIGTTKSHTEQLQTVTFDVTDLKSKVAINTTDIEELKKGGGGGGVTEHDKLKGLNANPEVQHMTSIDKINVGKIGTIETAQSNTDKKVEALNTGLTEANAKFPIIEQEIVDTNKYMMSMRDDLQFVDNETNNKLSDLTLVVDTNTKDITELKKNTGVTKEYVDTQDAKKADKATTLDGYGIVDGVKSNTANIIIGAGARNIGGINPVIIGTDARCSSSNSIAIGYTANAEGGASSVSIGTNAKSANGSIAISCGGRDAIAYGDTSIAIGCNAYIDSTSSASAIAIGSFAKSNFTNAISIGNNTTSDNTNTIAFGTSTKASSVHAIAIGTNAKSELNGLSFTSGIAIGGNTIANGNGVALGIGARALGSHSVAIGSAAVADYENNISIGKYAKNFTDSIFTLGNGSMDAARSTVFEVKNDGTIMINNRTATVLTDKSTINATKLAKPVNINGIAFDGSTDITIPGGSGGASKHSELKELNADTEFQHITTTEKNTYAAKADKATTLAGYGIVDGVKIDDSRLTNARPASDVYAWAKSPNKPTYEFNEIGNGSLVNIKITPANTSVGASALQANTTGSYNTASGADSLRTNTTGYSNTASGCSALYSNTTGNYNTANGVNALYSNTTGNYNTANGRDALYSNTTGYYNTANGRDALLSNTTGYYNTANGASSLQANTTFSNCSGLGFNSQVTADNQIQLGDSATTTYCYGAVQNRSDIRDKSDIRDTKLGLDFISKLRPVDFKWDMREDYRQPLKEDATEEERNKWLEDSKLSNITHDGTHKRGRYHHGLIAQEVQELIKDNKLDFGGFQDHSKNGGDDVLSIGYEELIAPMIKAIQELKAEVDSLKTLLNNK